MQVLHNKTMMTKQLYFDNAGIIVRGFDKPSNLYFGIELESEELVARMRASNYEVHYFEPTNVGITDVEYLHIVINPNLIETPVIRIEVVGGYLLLGDIANIRTLQNVRIEYAKVYVTPVETIRNDGSKKTVCMLDHMDLRLEDSTPISKLYNTVFQPTRHTPLLSENRRYPGPMYNTEHVPGTYIRDITT